jgi:pimeloyl-ACP methyl ester carboxylesterase
MLRRQKPLLVTVLVFASVLVCRYVSSAALESDFFDAKGVKIHYLIEGTGEPVVLIHGLDSSAAINWEMPGTIDALAKDHLVVALDLPGYGQSDKPVEASAYGRQWVEDVILLLDHLKIEKAHIVGYSMGGMVALKLIAEHPDRVLSGTLGGMGWLPEDSFLQKIWAHMRSVSARGVSELALTETELKSIRVPVEILVGDRDPMRQLYVVRLQKVRGDWSVVEIQNAGHLNCIFKKQFIDELEKWLDLNRRK